MGCLRWSKNFRGKENELRGKVEMAIWWWCHKKNFENGGLDDQEEVFVIVWDCSRRQDERKSTRSLGRTFSSNALPESTCELFLLLIRLHVVDVNITTHFDQLLSFPQQWTIFASSSQKVGGITGYIFT